MDIALTPTLDLDLSGADIVTDNTLSTAVRLSLLAERRAETDDPHDGDRRGWWADAWPPVEGDRVGSRLWLLARAKRTPATLQSALHYAEQALAWLVEDGHASGVEVSASWSAQGHLTLHVLITLPNGSSFPVEVSHAV